MDLMHAPTGSIMFVAVYWVTFATVMSPATASLIVAPVYLAPYVKRVFHWLRAHRRHTH